jgi:hypothetical protein
MGLCIRLRVSQWMWCAYRGCRTVNIDVLLHLLHTGSTDTGNLSTHLRTGRTHPGRDLGALRASAPPGGGIQFRPGERPPSRQKQAALCTNATWLSRLRRRPSHHFIVHAPKARQGNGERQAWAPHVALHRSCTQGKARQWGTPGMGTTRRTGINTSPNGVRDERESRGGSR